MSNLNDSADAGRATVPQILADLLVLGHDLSLPDPVDMNAMSNGVVSVSLVTRADLDAWNKTLGGGKPDCHAYKPDPGKCLHGSWINGRRGWDIKLSALVAVHTPNDPLPDDVRATLAVITDGQEVSPDDRVQLTSAGEQAAETVTAEPASDYVISRSDFGAVRIRTKSPDPSTPLGGELLGFTRPLPVTGGWCATWRNRGEQRHTETAKAADSITAEALLFDRLGIDPREVRS